MANAIDRELIRSLFLNNIPLMDVRAPVEFEQGAFPNAVNYPLMNDQERHEVGIRYKQAGQDAAIKLGNKLVSGDIKAQRIAQWKAFAEQNPDGYLYCFRGGLRSRTTQQWLKEQGIELPLVNGGYKAMRRVLIDELEQAVEQSGFVILGGKTGTGKTWLLKELSHSIDLEGLAHHRGSSFGRFPDGQPRQISFENNLAILLMRLRAAGAIKFWLEDEGRMIGSICLPQSLRDKMTEAPLVMLEEDLDYRINVILKDYVIDLYAYYQQFNAEQNNSEQYKTELYISENGNQNNVSSEPSRLSQKSAFEQFSDYLLSSLERVKKRLGNDRYQHINKLMSEALKEQSDSGSLAAHKLWIETLLISYYDPMYEYQLEKKQHRVIFRGNSHQILSNQTKILDMC